MRKFVAVCGFVAFLSGASSLAGASPALATALASQPGSVGPAGPPSNHTGTVSAVSCAAAGYCVAVGAYDDDETPFESTETKGVWGDVAQVPGFARLGVGVGALKVVACPSRGDCSAAGTYRPEATSSGTSVFVVDLTKGAWGTAEALPNLAKLNVGIRASVSSVSCSSSGNCSVAGSYTDSSGNMQGFVANEVDGTWGTAEELPGLSKLNSGGAASVDGLSCRSADECSAAGGYTDSSGNGQVFVANEAKGVWGDAAELPGFGTLGSSGASSVEISCASSGNCAAGGSYVGDSGFALPFLVTESSGTWAKAEAVPGFTTFSGGGYGNVLAISCSPTGGCNAGGYYSSASTGYTEAFVVGAPKGTWGDPQEVPGFTALNAGNYGELDTMSCASADNCTAGGYYLGASDEYQSFVAVEAGGTWANAKEAPGFGSVGSTVASISCPTAGNCSAGGSYTDTWDNAQGYVTDETSGSWASAEEVPGLAAADSVGTGEITAISCESDGACTAVGNYSGTNNRQQAVQVIRSDGSWGKLGGFPGVDTFVSEGGTGGALSVSCTTKGNCSAGGAFGQPKSEAKATAFVANEVSGSWSMPEDVANPKAGGSGGAGLVAISCSTAGNCAGGGDYSTAAGNAYPFAVNETGGTWAKAAETPGFTQLYRGDYGGLSAISCTATGDCTAGGYVALDEGGYFAFVVDEVHGTWASAKLIPGYLAMSDQSYAGVTVPVASVSCASPGNCTVGGAYRDKKGHQQAYVADEVKGTWKSAEEAPGTSSLNAGNLAQVSSVDCRSAGNCTAGGFYTDKSGKRQAFVVTETNAIWAKAREVPGFATLNVGGAGSVISLSCSAAGDCGAAGTYTDKSGHTQAFVDTQTKGTWRTAEAIPGFTTLNAGGAGVVSAISCGSTGNCSAGGGYTTAHGLLEPFVVTETNGRWGNAEEVPNAVPVG